MAIIGAHALLETTEPEQLHATLRDLRARGGDARLYEPRHAMAIAR